MMINKEEALVLLSFHSGRNDDIKNEKWSKGFLGALHTFDWEPMERNFIEIMECLRVLNKEFSFQKIDRNLIADIYGIYYQVNIWLSKDGRLKNISLEKRKKLEEWMNIYAYAVMLLVNYTQEGVAEAFAEFDDYLRGYTNYD